MAHCWFSQKTNGQFVYSYCHEKQISKKNPPNSSFVVWRIYGAQICLQLFLTFSECPCKTHLNTQCPTTVSCMLKMFVLWKEAPVIASHLSSGLNWESETPKSNESQVSCALEPDGPLACERITYIVRCSSIRCILIKFRSVKIQCRFHRAKK